MTLPSPGRRRSEKVLQLAAARQQCSSPGAARLSAVSQRKAQKGLQTLFLDAFPCHPALVESSLLLLHSQMSLTQDLAGVRVKCCPLGLLFLHSRKCMCVAGVQGETNVFRQLGTSRSVSLTMWFCIPGTHGWK